MKIRIAAVSLVLAVSACNRQQAAPLPPRTAHFFETHDVERTDMLAKCKTEDREYQQQEECANAWRAQKAVNIAHDAGQTIK